MEDEYVPDSESVRQQRELHHQPQSCTLSQCFQLYTKEEQVGVQGLASLNMEREVLEENGIPSSSLLL